MTSHSQAKRPRLALTGATGRVATLLRPFLPTASWFGRGDDLSAVAGHDALICLAGVTGGDPESLRDNSEVARTALQAAEAEGVPRVFLISSAAVYGRATGPLRAEAAPTPASPYGAAKADMEAAVEAWRATAPSGIQAVVLRLGNVAGADALLGALRPGTVPDLHTWPDGSTPRRSYIGPRFLASVLTRLATLPGLPDTLNVAAPGAVEMAELLRAAGRDWTPVPAPPGAIAEVRLDTAPLARLVPLPPEAGTAEGMVGEWREATA